MKNFIKYENKTLRNIFLWCLALLQTLFPIVLITYLLLILLETVFKNSVSSYINLNYLLLTVIVVGIFFVLTSSKTTREVKDDKLSIKVNILIFLIGLGCGVIVWHKTKEIGWFSYLVSIVSAGLTIVLSLLIWQKEEAPKPNISEYAMEGNQVTTKQKIKEIRDNYTKAKKEAKESMNKAIKQIKKDEPERKNSQDN